MGSLRKLLGSRSAWIVTGETGYALLPGVRLLEMGREEELRRVWARGEREARSAPRSAVPELSLNHRQLTILNRAWKPNDSISVPEYRALFRVSEITALRDLAGLHRQGLMIRVGRARATRYLPGGFHAFSK